MDKNKQDLKYALVRMSNVLVTKSTRMDAEYQKLFYIALASIVPTQQNNEVIINKTEIFDLLGLKNNDKHARLREMFKKLMKKSFVEFGDDEEYVDGFLIYEVRTTRKDIILTFNNRYMPLLAQLSTNYTRLLNDDLIHFNSKFSMMLYQFLMKNNDNVKTIYPVTLTTRQLKQLFGLSDTDYCRKKDGKFDRVSFEKYTLNKAVEEINEKAKCIHNLQYIKHYKHRLVTHYEFKYTTLDPQTIAGKMKSDDVLEGQLSFDVDNPSHLKEKNEHETSNFEWWKD